MRQPAIDRVSRVASRIYALLLAAVPTGFRRDYGPLMRQAFHDLCREALAQRGLVGLIGVWRLALVDLMVTVFKERSRTMGRGLVLVLGAIGLGVLIALVDASPGWDDTGVTALALVAVCGLLSVADPTRPWRWSALVGLWIPALSIGLHRNFGSVLAVAFALAGAYLGAAVGRLVRRPVGSP